MLGTLGVFSVDADVWLRGIYYVVICSRLVIHKPLEAMK